MKASVLIIPVLLVCGVTAGAQQWQERPDWAPFFAEAGVKGTMAILDERSGSRWVFDQTRSQHRYSPASTFKIPHALFALEAGVVRDEFQIFTWDGVKRSIESWNQDQTLRSSIRFSTVWLYQLFARQIGVEQEREYLQRISYGSGGFSGPVDEFWLNGALEITAQEQIAFLQRLYRNELPFKVEHQRLVKDLMINAAGREWILRAKTGWSVRDDEQVGWWVGWVERPEGAVFFALNIDMPGGGADAPKREKIARAILRSIAALPPE